MYKLVVLMALVGVANCSWGHGAWAGHNGAAHDAATRAVAAANMDAQAAESAANVGWVGGVPLGWWGGAWGGVPLGWWGGWGAGHWGAGAPWGAAPVGAHGAATARLAAATQAAVTRAAAANTHAAWSSVAHGHRW